MATLFKIVNGELMEMTPDEAREHIELARHTDEEINKNLYKDRRVSEYPSIGDQLDVIWKFLGTLPLDKDAKNMYNIITDIKAKYPK